MSKQQEMFVLKRDKKLQKFDFNKIVKAVSKAFKASSQEISQEELIGLCKEVKIESGSSIELIQNQIEDILMHHNYFKVAKKFILYRAKKAESRNIENKKAFIKEYTDAENAATGSKYDPNSNVTEKNICTLNGELFKGDAIKLNRSRMCDMMDQLYGKEPIKWKFGVPTSIAQEYIRMLTNHSLYKHDETSIYPYCVSVTMYPLLLDGLQKLGGISKPPKYLRSFCGIFVNFVFTVAAQFAGAVATGEFLTYFDYFCRKDYGQDYYKHLDQIVEFNPAEAEEYNQMIKNLKLIADKVFNDMISDHDLRIQLKDIIQKEKFNFKDLSGHTLGFVIHQYFQNVVYYLNQPAAARNFQSVFWNISYFDKYYFEGIFKDFYFPDGTAPCWESVSFLQKYFMKWFNAERSKTLLTFPVETMACLTDKEDLKDKDYADFTAEMYAEGHSFFTYLSDSPDSLSSCCRLRNEIQENQFSYTLGAGGISTGSKSVMTLNINQMIQDACKHSYNMFDYIREQVQKVQKFQIAFNEIIKNLYKKHMLTVYDAGFISLQKQYLTLGINGLVESAEFLGFKISPNEDYKNYISAILKIFNEENKKARTKDAMFNTEYVPAENLGVKNAKWNKNAGYWVPRDCYNSYFYVVEDTSLSILDKFKLHGKDFVKYLDGGSALHMNLDEHLTKQQYRYLLKYAAQKGTNYFTFNIPNSACSNEKCGYRSKHFIKSGVCPKCSALLDYETRVIGYLKKVRNFSHPRQIEASKRFYAPNTEDVISEINKELDK